MSTTLITTKFCGLEAMPMHSPPHPGRIIRELCLDPLDLSVTDAAKGLGISRKHFSDIVNGHAGISSEMAIRLSKAFGRTPEAWLKQQMLYDLWHARQREGDMDVKRFKAA